MFEALAISALRRGRMRRVALRTLVLGLGRLVPVLLPVLLLLGAPGGRAEDWAADSGAVAGHDAVAGAAWPSAHDLIAAAIDQTRGRTSFAEMVMEVHRPDWQRSSSISAWTRGREDAFIRFTGPPRDAGNATLKDGEQMWTFTPRLNRVVRLPYSMMSQSWAGSDFSYNDLSRTDSLLQHYTHTLLDVKLEDGHRIYTIESIPDADAPVVWGRQVLVMRDDNVMLDQTFFDQDDVALKRLETRRIGELGGRVIPVVMRMSKLDEPDHWTEVRYRAAEFDIEVPDRRFTLFALRNQDG